jgi:hypothetical protein
VLNTNHFPKIEMRKFDGKDPITWILQMEQLFYLHDVPHSQKVQISSLYLEPNQFLWYRWLCSLKSLVTWTIFTKELITHYEDTRRNNFFSQLINLKQKCLVGKHIENFQMLYIKVMDILDEHMIDAFIGTLKDNIQHEFCLWEPTSLENALRVAKMLKVKICQWLLEGTLLTSIKRIMFILLKQLNLHGGHLKNWRKENKKVYALIVTTSTVRDISVMRRNYSTYILKRKKKNNKKNNHLKMKT